MAQRMSGTGAGEVAGMLSVTFVHGGPDLRRDLSAIPG